MFDLYSDQRIMLQFNNNELEFSDKDQTTKIAKTSHSGISTDM